MRFVHAADLHLDSPITGLSRYQGAPTELLSFATRGAMQNLVRLCIQEEARLLLLAGDLFDGEWKDYSTGLFFVSQLKELERAGVQVALVRGNHDAVSQVTKYLKLPGNVRQFAAEAPETFTYEELGVAVHGQSYARRAETNDLSRNYPPAIPGYTNIGLLHTAAGGRAGHEPYAPCNLDTLIGKGYDYWALGHVHQREVLCEQPWVVFSGNLQGRNVREVGPKGATLVEVDNLRVSKVEARELDLVRFERLEVQVSLDARDLEAVLDAIEESLTREVWKAENRVLVVRVVLLGSTTLHSLLVRDSARFVAEVRSRALAHPKLWVEAVKLATRPVEDLRRLAEREDAIGRVFRSLSELRAEPARRAQLLPALSDLLGKLPAELQPTSGSFGTSEQESAGGSTSETAAESAAEAAARRNDAWILEALDEVEELLLCELSPSEEPS